MNFSDWRDQNSVFTAMAAASNTPLHALGAPADRCRSVERACRRRTSTSIGIQPAIGRTFAAGEDTPGRDRVVVISHALWQEQLRPATRSVVGRAIPLDGIPYTVIGVMPADSPFERGWAKLWRPLAFTPGEQTRDYHWLSAIARLKPGVTFEQAQANMDAIGARIARDYPHSNKDWGVHLDRLSDILVGNDLRQSLKVLLGAVGTPAAARLRQSRQPVAGARHQPRA